LGFQEIKNHVLLKKEKLNLTKIKSFILRAISIRDAGKLVFLAICILGFYLTSCTKEKSSSESGTPVSLSAVLSLTRLTTSSPNPIQVLVSASRSDAASISGLTVAPTVTNGTAGAVSDLGSGQYTFQVIPSAASGDVLISVDLTGGGLTANASKTAVVIPTISSDWGQAEAVEGFVNTDGYEDGPEVSPDGQWLMVSDYSPMDVIKCQLVDGNSPSATSCKTAIGPYAAPIRPSLPGANRILSGGTSLSNRCDNVCFTSNGQVGGSDVTTAALPPISAYVFKRQADGSFKDPKIIAYAADGCAHLMGISFLSSPLADGTAKVVFAWESPYDGSGHTHRVKYSSINVNNDTILGTMSCVGTYNFNISNDMTSNLTSEAVPNLGNPNAQGGNYLWIDDESNGDLRYFSIPGSLPGATPSGETAVAHAPAASDRRKMPFFHSPTSTLFYSRNNKAIDSRPLLAPDPSNAGSWGSVVPILDLSTEAGTGTVGRITAIGEPSLADLSGGTRELYFIYVVITPTGVNANVAKIRKN
jgi:hypothetical protein